MECYEDDPWHRGGDAVTVHFRIVDGKRVMQQQPVMHTFWIASGMDPECVSLFGSEVSALLNFLLK